MRRSQEKKILHALFGFGLISLLTLMKRPVKDWIIVFFFKAFLTGFVDSFVVNKWKRITYPVRLCPKAFKINILYDLLLFPITCVWFNQWTMKKSIKGIIGRVFIFSIPMTVIELIAEKKTKLLKFKEWNGFYSLISLSTTFLLTRGFMGLVRKLDNKLDSNKSSMK